MSRRALCDTNVLASAFIASGPPSRVVELAIGRRIALVLADPVLAELERVLTVKLRLGSARVADIGAFLTDLAGERVPTPEEPPERVTSDAADNLILACAVAARVDWLVSGDRRHLLPVGEHRGMPIVTPVALLAELAATRGDS